MKILPLRDIPRNTLKAEYMVKKREKAIAYHNGVYHRQMVGRDKPRPLMLPIDLRHLGSNLFKFTDTVTHQEHKQKTERHCDKRRYAPDKALQEKPGSIVSFYHTPFLPSPARNGRNE
jgi:hypothetical protein